MNDDYEEQLIQEYRERHLAWQNRRAWREFGIGCGLLAMVILAIVFVLVLVIGSLAAMYAAFAS